MSSTTKTTNYNLSQFADADKPTWRGDYNGDMLKIDRGMQCNANAAADAHTAAARLYEYRTVNGGDKAGVANTVQLVRLLDFVLVSKDDDGDVSVIEVEDTDALGFGGVQLAAVGITGDDDIVELAELIPPGTSAVVAAFELLYLRALSERLAASGGVVLSAERIPAPVVNAVFDLVEAEGE